MNAPIPDPTLGSQAIPTTPCDSCGKEFAPGGVWNYHARLGVYVHTSCAANGPVRGEDITTHTVLWGQVPPEPPTVWQGDGVRAVASGLVAVDDGEESDE